MITFRIHQVRGLFAVSLAMASLGLDGVAYALSLEDVRHAAARASPEAKTAQAALDLARAQRGRAESAFRPRIGLAAGLEAQASAAEQQAAPSAFVYGAWPLFDAAKLEPQRRLADVEVERAATQLEAAKARAAWPAERLFFGVVKARTLATLKQEAMAASERHRRLARQRLDAGLVSAADLSEFEVQAALQKTELESLLREAELRGAELELVAGLPVGAARDVPADLTPDRIEGKLDDYLAQVSVRNNVLVAAGKSIAATDARLAVVNASARPIVELETRLGFLPIDERVGNERLGGTVMLLAKWPLFEGAYLRAEREEIAAARRHVEAELAASFTHAVREATVRFNAARAAEAAATAEQATLAVLERHYRAVLRAYDRGVKSSADVMSAANLIEAARVRRIASLYSAATERIALEEALGFAVKMSSSPADQTP